MNEQVNYAKIQRIQDDLEALTIGTFGTGFCTDAMLYESGIKATVANHTSQLANIATNINSFPRLGAETGDSARIQRAIDYLYNKYSGQHIGKIKFPAGVYSIDAEINARTNGLHIEGDGNRPNGTIFQATASITNMFGSADTCNHGIIIEKCRINGNNLASNGVVFNQTGENSKIRDVVVRDCLINGIWTKSDTAPFTLDDVAIFSCKNGVQINGGHTYNIFTLSTDNCETPVLITGGGTVSLNLNIIGFKCETMYTGVGNTNYLSNDIIVFDNVAGCKLNLFGLTTYSNVAEGYTHPSRNSLIKIKNTTYGDYEPSIMVDSYYLDSAMVYIIDNDAGLKIPKGTHSKGDTICYGRSLGAIGGKEGYIFGNAIVGKTIYTGDYELTKDIIRGAQNSLNVDATTGNDNNNGYTTGTSLATFAKALSKIPSPITAPITINVTSNIDEEIVLKDIVVTSTGALTINCNNHTVKDIYVKNCKAPQVATGGNIITIKNCTCLGTGTSSGQNIRVESSTVTFENVSCTDSTKTTGITLHHFSRVGLYNVTVSNKTNIGISLWTNTYAMISTLNGSANGTGLSVNEFSQVVKNFTYPTSPAFATTNQTTSQGGTVA